MCTALHLGHLPTCAVKALALTNSITANIFKEQQEHLSPVAKGVLQGDLDLKGASALHLALGQGLAVGVQSSHAPGGRGPRHHPHLQATAESGPAVQCCSCKGAAHLCLK